MPRPATRNGVTKVAGGYRWRVMIAGRKYTGIERTEAAAIAARETCKVRHGGLPRHRHPRQHQPGPPPHRVLREDAMSTQTTAVFVTAAEAAFIADLLAEAALNPDNTPDDEKSINELAQRFADVED